MEIEETKIPNLFRKMKDMKIPIVGYTAMVLCLIYTTLFIYGFVRLGVISILISSVLIWIWGGISIYLIYKANEHGRFLAVGFISFTIIVMIIIAYASFISGLI